MELDGAAPSEGAVTVVGFLESLAEAFQDLDPALAERIRDYGVIAMQHEEEYLEAHGGNGTLVSPAVELTPSKPAGEAVRADPERPGQVFQAS